MITLRGVTHRFGDRVVLDGLDLDLPDGTVTTVMGPSGIGKTTLARLLLGLLTPDGGEVRGLDGLRRAAVFQEDRLCEQLDAVGNVRLVLGRGVPPAVVVAELAAVGLAGDDLAKPVHLLSGGQRRRVAIVRALAADADLVVLDEPFTGMDAATKARTMVRVHERCAGRTVLLVTHDPGEAAWFGTRTVRLAAPAAPGAAAEDA